MTADIVDELRSSRSAGWGSLRRPSAREVRAADEIERLRAENEALRSVLGRPDYHIVRFTEDGWTVQHPPQDGPALFDCPYAGGFDGPPPGGLGDYRWDENGLTLIAAAGGTP